VEVARLDGASAAAIDPAYGDRTIRFASGLIEKYATAQEFSRLHIGAVVLLYVYDGAQDITTYFDQGSVAHDFYGCLLRPAVLPTVTPSRCAHVSWCADQCQ
jgi:hypothetical protein